MKKLILLTLGFGLSLTLFAQPAIQLADSAFKNENYLEAIANYKKVLSKKKQSDNIKLIDYRIAECYRLSNNFKDAVDWYQKSQDAGYTEPGLYLGYGDVLMKMGEYEKAKTYYKDYLKINPTDKLTNVKYESCFFAVVAAKERPLYQIENLKDINTEYTEYGIGFYNDNLIVSSSRLRKMDKRHDPSTLEGFSDIYMAPYLKESQKWGSPTPLEGQINSYFNEGTFSYSAKENAAYYMQCNGVNGKKDNCNILLSKYNSMSKSWDAPEIFPFNSKVFSIGHPSINEKGDILYFVSDMPGGEGGKDIYRIRKNGDAWGTPENLGPTINTMGDEMFPFISGDTLLVFSSDGHLGMGSLDIFFSKMDKNGKFGTPVNLKAPFNSTADDYGLIFNKPNCTEGFFCSNRVEGSVGGDDVYSFSLLAVVLNASGIVLNRKDNTPIKNVQVTYARSDGHIDTAFTDKNGYYAFKNIHSDSKYLLKVEKVGYFTDSKTFSIEPQQFSKDFNKAMGKDLDMTMLPLTKDEIEISDIYYDFNSAALREQSKIELDKLVKMLTETPDVIIVLNSHTDSRGKDKYNLNLSQQRAQSVVDYLISKNIDKSRLSAKGWGKNKPIVKDAVTEEEHQKNRRTTFNVVNADKFIAREDSAMVEFCLQFTASKVPVSKEVTDKYLKLLPGELIKNTKADDGYYRYTIGSYPSFEDATAAQNKVLAAGKEAFVVAFYKGEKISLAEAKKLTGSK